MQTNNTFYRIKKGYNIYDSILINKEILQINYKTPVPEYLLTPLVFQHMCVDVRKYI